MYTPLNNRIIVKKPSERKTESGIILSEQDTGAVFEFDVFSTPTEYMRISGKKIVAERRHVTELPEKGYGAIKYEDIIAIKEV